ncbi:MAG TPA: ubiquitin-like domain-containing protein [Dongiaceae bacterium]|nr:ubiquitin-like domain-containing protein [Dongiaceae bacterium]
MNLIALLSVHKKLAITIGGVVLLVLFLPAFLLLLNQTTKQAHIDSRHLITLYDRGVKTVFLSNAKTVGDALKQEGISLDSHDAVEPSAKEELIAPNYWVNIYRARPVIVTDGSVRIKTVTPYQSPAQIAKDVGMPLGDDDLATLSPSNDFVSDGAGLELTISRATSMWLDLYGKQTQIRTRGKTIAGMLKEKGVTLGKNDRTSLPLTTPITTGLQVRVWREGKQTVTVDQPIQFGTDIVQDADRYVNYKAITTPGKNGVQTISYEIEIQGGVEISRTQIASIVAQQPVRQVETIGIKSFPDALTKSKGAQYYTDSKGVTHRETYYDLDMHVVMQACGQGGYYAIRIDGVKVDADGYVIVAANYGNYPRCSVVETSVGPAKVYDTGGFATRYPDGFDIATDWTDYNGR